MLRITIPERRIILAATAFLALIVPIVAYATLRGGSTANSQSTAIPFTNLEVELITLRPSGFEPSEITRSKGAFVLFIDNRTGKQNSSLVLQSGKGDRLRSVDLHREKSEWTDVLDLAQGNYVLQDASDSALRCQITILP